VISMAIGVADGLHASRINNDGEAGLQIATTTVFESNAAFLVLTFIVAFFIKEKRVVK